MEENFLNKAELIVNEIREIKEGTSLSIWNDHRASSMNKNEEIDENTREGEILLILKETSEIDKRKELINELNNLKKKKKDLLKEELNNEIEIMKVKLEKEGNTIDRKILKANELLKRVERALRNNEMLIENRDKDSLVYKAAKIENEKNIKRKDKMPEIITTLKEEQKKNNLKKEFYSSIDVEKDGIEKIEKLIKENKKEESKKEENNKNVETKEIDSSIINNLISSMDGRKTENNKVGGSIADSLFDKSEVSKEELEEANVIVNSKKTIKREGMLKKSMNKILNLSRKIKGFVKNKINNIKPINLGKNKLNEEEYKIPKVELKSVEPKNTVERNSKRLNVKKAKINTEDAIRRMEKAAEIKLAEEKENTL